jgi:hypothetical protein
VPFATRLTKVRYRSAPFNERTGVGYHEAPPAERVVVHVRDAGQAKPHQEHNPLSLLGACYATPRRQLNDPGTLFDRFVQSQSARVHRGHPFVYQHQRLLVFFTLMHFRQIFHFKTQHRWLTQHLNYR